jgi:ribosomal protein S30
MQIHRPKSRYFVQRSLGLSLCAVVVLGLAAASQAAGPKVRRARLPQFPQNVTDAFFPDANSKLVGPRPTAGAAKASVTPQETRPSTTADAAPSGSETWSKLISAEAVEDEIKSRQVLLAKAVQNATRFKSGENQQARTELGILATMLAIVAEYDGNIRWQRDAAAMRDVLARAGSNCKVASDAAYQDAAQRGEELQNLIRGDTPSFPAPAGAVEWPRLADRSELMKRLEQAEQQAIAPAVASEAAFKKNTDKLLHDAQITAALADVITRPGFEYADDETYLQHAHAMREQAKLLRDAALQGNYQQARQAAGALGQTCTNCHEGYRS